MNVIFRRAKLLTKFVYNTTTIQGQQQIRNNDSSSKRKNSSDSQGPGQESYKSAQKDESFLTRKDKFLNHPLLTPMKDLLTKPESAYIGEKPIGLNFYIKRLNNKSKNSLIYN
jgi:hypothetical protein